MTTIADIKRMYPHAIEVKQLGSKPLFMVTRSNYPTILLSYRTVIGILDGLCWMLTKEKYSVTTSKQTTWFIRNYNAQRVEVEYFKVLLAS